MGASVVIIPYFVNIAVDCDCRYTGTGFRASRFFLFFGLAICDRQEMNGRVCEARAFARASQTLPFMGGEMCEALVAVMLGSVTPH
jgi:hypothetical protein